MAWTAYEIPLQPTPQLLSVTLAGVVYQLTVRWNSFAGTWVLDIAGQSGSPPLVQGIPMLTGQDLLAQYAYLQIGGKLVVQTDQTPYALPTKTDLGTLSHLYFLVSA
jgi:hypothetical protein